jgi:hypothetical protein
VKQVKLPAVLSAGIAGSFAAALIEAVSPLRYFTVSLLRSFTVHCSLFAFSLFHWRGHRLPV